MLFNLGGEIYNVPFWMYKVNFPLDIFYIKDNVVTTVVYNAQPCHKLPCPIYKGRVDNQVLELPNGVANIKVGDRLKIQPLSTLPKNDIGFDSGDSLRSK
ncbi:DUF192 domain-containing protein [Nostoc sp. PCC 7120 = FACHB-418]|nr:DUF192 domain-containing protein [Nostoc sp. PCC 7120 = FACHB-418]